MVNRSRRQSLHGAWGWSFKNLSNLTRALTHTSYLNENSDAVEDNERMEFLGDAVLGFVVGAWVYHHCPEMRKGELTRSRSALVRNGQLAEFARKLELGRHCAWGMARTYRADATATICSAPRSRRSLAPCTSTRECRPSKNSWSRCWTVLKNASFSGRKFTIPRAVAGMGTGARIGNAAIHHGLHQRPRPCQGL